jgi:Novel toxin 16
MDCPAVADGQLKLRLQPAGSQSGLKKMKSAKSENRPLFWRRIRINEDCIRARQNIMNECYRGGDKAHQDEVDNVRKVLQNCFDAWDALGGV